MVSIHLYLTFLNFYLLLIIFLLLGVGPDVDCEIDDDSDEPDYMSKNTNCKIYKYFILTNK